MKPAQVSTRCKLHTKGNVPAKSSKTDDGLLLTGAVCRETDPRMHVCMPTIQKVPTQTVARGLAGLLSIQARRALAPVAHSMLVLSQLYHLSPNPPHLAALAQQARPT